MTPQSPDPAQALAEKIAKALTGTTGWDVRPILPLLTAAFRSRDERIAELEADHAVVCVETANRAARAKAQVAGLEKEIDHVRGGEKRLQEQRGAALAQLAEARGLADTLETRLRAAQWQRDLFRAKAHPELSRCEKHYVWNCEWCKEPAPEPPLTINGWRRVENINEAEPPKPTAGTCRPPYHFCQCGKTTGNEVEVVPAAAPAPPREEEK